MFQYYRPTPCFGKLFVPVTLVAFVLFVQADVYGQACDSISVEAMSFDVYTTSAGSPIGDGIDEETWWILDFQPELARLQNIIRLDSAIVTIDINFSQAEVGSDFLGIEDFGSYFPDEFYGLTPNVVHRVRVNLFEEWSGQTLIEAILASQSNTDPPFVTSPGELLMLYNDDAAISYVRLDLYSLQLCPNQCYGTSKSSVGAVCQLVVNVNGDESDVNLTDEACDVDSGEDGEQCTLRAAIENANQSGIQSSIFFNIPSPLSTEIVPVSPLPELLVSVDIDAQTQPSTPVQIIGNGMQASAAGLVFKGSRSALRGAIVAGFPGDGVVVSGADEFTLVSSELAGNGGNGLLLKSGIRHRVGDGQGNGNSFRGNTLSGVRIEDSNAPTVNNRIQGNRFRENREGGLALSNSSGNWIGGDDHSDESNHVRQNMRFGLSIENSSGANHIYGNEFVFNEFGVVMDGSIDARIGGAGPGEGNEISQSDSSGVLIKDSAGPLHANQLVANRIESNGKHGVDIRNSTGVVVGGGTEDEGNEIEYNTGSGVVITGTSSRPNLIRANRFRYNGSIAIDLENDGPTANDLKSPITGRQGRPEDADHDVGPNGLLNAPVAIMWTPDPRDASNTIISGFIDHPAPATLTIDFYGTDETTLVGGFHHGQADGYLGSASPRESGVIQFILSANEIPGEWSRVSATATDADGSTSEMSLVCTADVDMDGLCDDWEVTGVDYDRDGLVDLNLGGRGASPARKDLFVEYDWMEAADHSHKPHHLALQDVERAFRAGDDVRVHFEEGETIPDVRYLQFTSTANTNTPVVGFDQIKWGSLANPCGTGAGDGRFGSAADRSSPTCAAILGAKRLTHRYMLMAHDLASKPGTGGIAELLGNDLAITLGGWSDAAILCSAGYYCGSLAGPIPPTLIERALRHKQAGSTWPRRCPT